MSEELFLKPDEIRALTGKQRKPAQGRALKGMGVLYKTRPDGVLIVSRSHVEKMLGGIIMGSDKPKTSPNWDYLNAPPQS